MAKSAAIVPESLILALKYHQEDRYLGTRILHSDKEQIPVGGSKLWARWTVYFMSHLTKGRSSFLSQYMEGGSVFFLYPVALIFCINSLTGTVTGSWSPRARNDCSVTTASCRFTCKWRIIAIWWVFEEPHIPA